MSRILRRPMFRGGRVDSRGTGITSGLGYEKGGRVGLANGGNPFNINLGGRNPPVSSGRAIYSNPAGPQLPKGLTYRGIFDAMKTGGKGMLGRLAPFNPFSAAGITMALPFLPSYLMAKANEPKTVEALEYMKSMNDSGVFDETGALDYEDFTKQIDILNQTGTPLKDSGVGLTTNQEDLSKLVEDIRIKKEEEANKKDNYNDQFTKTDDTEESTEISKEDIEKNKELFAELLGGGKARGEDISNMLMSFAGKALKPEATVKGAFGEFFEEEAKRPSSKTKVDQAAAQLAINDYIAGKRSKEATENLLAKLKVQADLGEADLYENIVKIAGPGSNPTVANLESALKVTKETRGKPVTRIKSTDTIEIEEKDYDSFLIFEDTKRIMYIDQNGNQIPIY